MRLMCATDNIYKLNALSFYKFTVRRRIHSRTSVTKYVQRNQQQQQQNILNKFYFNVTQNATIHSRSQWNSLGIRVLYERRNQIQTMQIL